jgi:peptidoglycan/LPS O-acetylase OafA/YrhL
VPSSLGLRVAAVVAAVQGLMLFGYSVYLVVQVARFGITGPAEVSNVPAVVLEILIFGLFGLSMLWSARGLWQVRRWARAPIVLGQLIAIVVAVPFVTATGTVERVVAIVTLVGVAACVVGIFHPRSTAELNAAD